MGGVRSNGVQVLAINGVEGVLPASTTTVYSDEFDLWNVVKLGLEFKATILELSGSFQHWL